MSGRQAKRKREMARNHARMEVAAAALLLGVRRRFVRRALAAHKDKRERRDAAYMDRERRAHAALHWRDTYGVDRAPHTKGA